MSDATQQSAATSMQRLMTQAEYARHLRVNRSTVYRQVASGLIPTRSNGLIDPEEADAARQANLDVAKQRLAIAEGTPSQASARTALAAELSLNEPLVEGGISKPEEGTYKAAQTQERQAKAEIAQVELARLRGELVPVREVEAAWSSLVLTARNRLIDLVEKIDDATIRAKQRRELDTILLDLSRGSACREDSAA